MKALIIFLIVFPLISQASKPSAYLKQIDNAIDKKFYGRALNLIKSIIRKPDLASHERSTLWQRYRKTMLLAGKKGVHSKNSFDRAGIYLKVSPRSVQYIPSGKKESFLRIVGFYPKTMSILEVELKDLLNNKTIYKTPRKFDFKNWKSSKDKFSFHLPKTLEIPEKGLYEVYVTYILHNQMRMYQIRSWFFLDQHIPQGHAQISQLNAKNVEWEEFFSDLYQPNQERKILMGIHQLKDKKPTTIWSSFVPTTDKTKAKRSFEFPLKTPLKKGKYFLHMTYQEITHINSIKVMREHAVMQDFVVP